MELVDVHLPAEAHLARLPGGMKLSRRQMGPPCERRLNAVRADLGIASHSTA